ncbi:hypothetical protein [Actinophytocola sp.]|uniref:hypothetical protein n=1 Tax=Actinophytocola sp. TaxID=1872138 RepID=UPI002D7E2BA0|nr:hypothetical protein [Actinophytocola sp.]HET9143352.1 hypothetical protein [Actinophytocola sp.]
MFQTGPLDEARGAPVRLRVSRAGRLRFDQDSALVADPGLSGYLADMVAPYGLAVREDVIAAGTGHSYGDMADPLIRTVTEPRSPVDVLVLVHAVHDVRFGRNTATYLGSRCPGDPLSFAVCDQGVAGAFTALRLIGAYAASGVCRRALLIVAEQSGLHYELAEPAPVPDRHAAVALLLEETREPDAVLVRQHRGVPPAEVADRLAADLADLSGPGPEPVVITGTELSTVDKSVPAPAGQPYTGVWWELAGRMAAHSRLLLADYDRQWGYLCTGAVRGHGV